MALTRDLTATFADAGAAKGVNTVTTTSYEIDFSDTDMSLVQNGVMGIVDLSAGTVVLGGMLEVLTAQTTVTDINIGISTSSADDNSLGDALTLASAAFVAFENTGPVNVVAASELVLTNIDTNTINTAKIKVTLIMARCQDV